MRRFKYIWFQEERVPDGQSLNLLDLGTPSHSHNEFYKHSLSHYRNSLLIKKGKTKWKNFILSNFFIASRIILPLIIFQLNLHPIILEGSILFVNFTHIHVELFKIGFFEQLLELFTVSSLVEDQFVLHSL